MVIFHRYVSLPEGMVDFMARHLLSGQMGQNPGYQLFTYINAILQVSLVKHHVSWRRLVTEAAVSE